MIKECSAIADDLLHKLIKRCIFNASKDLKQIKRSMTVRFTAGHKGFTLYF